MLSLFHFWHRTRFSGGKHKMGEEMDLQAVVMKRYVELNGSPTLKQIAADTGIQLTRVFRLFNGSEMKLSEYEIFNQKVKEKMGLASSLEEIAFECSKVLSASAVSELEGYLLRKIHLWKMIHEKKQYQQAA